MLQPLLTLAGKAELVKLSIVRAARRARGSLDRSSRREEEKTWRKWVEVGNELKLLNQGLQRKRCSSTINSTSALFIDLETPWAALTHPATSGDGQKELHQQQSVKVTRQKETSVSVFRSLIDSRQLNQPPINSRVPSCSNCSTLQPANQLLWLRLNSKFACSQAHNVGHWCHHTACGLS